MADLDGDGDLDLVKGGTEPVLRVFECVGGARYVDRGWLTSGGETLVLPRDDRNRSWVSVSFRLGRRRRPGPVRVLHGRPLHEPRRALREHDRARAAR